MRNAGFFTQTEHPLLKQPFKPQRPSFVTKDDHHVYSRILVIFVVLHGFARGLSLQLRLYGGVWPWDWKIDPSAD